MLFALKIPSGFRLLVYKHDGLYYIKVLGTTILVYGRTFDEALDELKSVVEDLSDAIKHGEIIADSLYQKVSLKDMLLYALGRINVMFLTTMFKDSKKLQEVDSDLRIMHA